MELHITLSGNILSCLRWQEDLNNESLLQRTFCGVYHNNFIEYVPHYEYLRTKVRQAAYLGELFGILGTSE